MNQGHLDFISESQVRQSNRSGRLRAPIIVLVLFLVSTIVSTAGFSMGSKRANDYTPFTNLSLGTQFIPKNDVLTRAGGWLPFEGSRTHLEHTVCPPLTPVEQQGFALNVALSPSESGREVKIPAKTPMTYIGLGASHSSSDQYDLIFELPSKRRVYVGCWSDCHGCTLNGLMALMGESFDIVSATPIIATDVPPAASN